MGEVAVRRLRAGEWRALRDLRIEALRTAPHAFATPWQEVAARPDRRWRADAALGAGNERPTFVAELDGALVGMATGWDTGASTELIQMYVRPAARGRGIGTALVAAVVDWARGRGRRRLELGVAEANDGAERLYRRCGFARTGVVRARTEGNVTREVRMALEL